MTALSIATDLQEAPASRQGLLIRPLRRDDGKLLDEVMAGMSMRSRYQRFHSPKPRLTASDRAYFTNVDGHDHLAVVGLAPHGAPLGVARAVRCRDDAAAAEVAVAIVDASQRQGVGTELIASLARRAAAAGIERLLANVLAETGLARSLKRRGWRVIAREGHTLTLEVAAWRVAASR
jgi:GNAT superfamily N-acetyltransferase